MLNTTGVIRSRGQLTIPDKIRAALEWPDVNIVVSITATPDKKLVIEPYNHLKQENIDWDDVWRRIKRSKSIKGKRGNLSKFIIEDRERH